eukprot:GHVS01036752.1.p3 GENE.GHVS01036752.1~~GHVS01036752.1.p3  ORF type:complete len:106 (-),score=12.85 GHVS01036752.1:282-599(-)
MHMASRILLRRRNEMIKVQTKGNTNNRLQQRLTDRPAADVFYQTLCISTDVVVYNLQSHENEQQARLFTFRARVECDRQKALHEHRCDDAAAFSLQSRAKIIASS